MDRHRDFFMPEICLDRSSQVSLHRQIYHQVAATIRCGGIARGARLPSTRLLAKLLGVSRNTVLVAYEDLVAEELIRGERGAGMRVNGSAPVTMPALRRLMREARYPARITFLLDMDGNPLFINF